MSATEDKQVAVVGLGYVGLPLALRAAEKGRTVIGLDINEQKIAKLEAGQSYIDDISDEAVKGTAVAFTTAPERLATADICIICVPTPLIEETQLPDLSPVKGAVELIAPHLRKGALVILESTVNPGVTDEVVIPLLESSTGNTVGTDIDVAYCPERINPGDANWHVGNIPRVVGGNSPQALKRAVEFYRSIVDAEVKPMGSIKEAEAVKVVENSFRDINIAFVNELAMSFHRLGINLENVIDGAATKPFSFMAHHPGCGVGGHCIPVDPYYLIDYARGHGFEHDLLRMARQVNEGMPAFTVEMLEEILNEDAKALKGARVALLGMSYKSNVGDGRESPAKEIKSLLRKKGAEVVSFDPHLPDESDVASLVAALEHAEAVVVATAHREFGDLSADMFKQYDIRYVVDGRNMLRGRLQTLKDAGIAYRGIGMQ